MAPTATCLAFYSDVLEVVFRSQDEDVLERVLLILLLEHAQFPLDPVQQVGALEAAASPVAAHHDGAEAAHQHRGPVHLKPLRHRLTAGRPVAARENKNEQDKLRIYIRLGSCYIILSPNLAEQLFSMTFERVSDANCFPVGVCELHSTGFSG